MNPLIALARSAGNMMANRMGQTIREEALTVIDAASTYPHQPGRVDGTHYFPYIHHTYPSHA